MSSKILGWLIGDWDGKISDLKKKSERKKKNSEINLKKGNPTFSRFYITQEADMRPDGVFKD